MTRSAFRALSTGTVYAMLAAQALAVDQGEPRVIHNDGQAMPKGALRSVQGSRTDRRSLKREAALELMDMSRKTLVVTHLHPRWLRQCVIDLMAAGANIDMAAVELLKSYGPQGAQMIVEAYDGGSLYHG